MGAGGIAAGKEFDLSSDETVIGRASGLPIILEGPNISRRHARILRAADAFSIEDLGSSNGTFVNDKRIAAKTLLRKDDLIRIGGYLFRFQADALKDDLTIQRHTIALPGNTELYGENPARKLQAVLQLAHELGNTLVLDELLDRFFDQLQKLFPSIDRAIIFFLDAGVPKVRLLRDRKPGPSIQPVFSRAVLKELLENGHAVLAADTRQLSPQNSLVALGIRSLLCAPLRSQGTPIFGGVQLERFQIETPFTRDDLHLLTAVTLQAAMAVDKSRMHEKLIRQEHITRELALAREIQQAFLPSCVPQLKNGAPDIAADLKPAEEVSGDFYDYIVLDEHRILVVIADVSGKGMPAALFMSMVRALLRQASRRVAGPVEILRGLNDTLARDNPKMMFVTLVLGVYDQLSGKCTIVRAGHPAPLLLPRVGRASEIDSHAGRLVGIAEGGTFEEASIQLAPGDTLIFYTDGVTEAAAHGEGELFGLNRLLKLANDAPKSIPLIQYLLLFQNKVTDFCAPSLPQDDVTIVLLRHTVGATV